MSVLEYGEAISPMPEEPGSIIVGRLQNYQEDSDEALHLRPHQSEAVAAFRETSQLIINGSLPNHGMSIIHPTGSGKTATGTEITRLTCASDGSNGDDLRALWLVPRLTIAQQTIGDDEQTGAINKFAPNMTVSEYSGRRKNLDGQVVVMPYQSLATAIKTGAIQEIDPALVVCDEAHHIIDSNWAQLIDRVRQDRLLLGLTATPDYSKTRTINGLFPYVLATKSMHAGIEEGVLANFDGHLYKGSAVINLLRHPTGEDFNDEEVFKALINSPDNLLAAQLCEQEVAQGRRGVVSCARGHDRAHAKTVAQLLQNITVDTPNGARTIRAAYIGSDLHQREIDSILEEYQHGLVDVLTHVDYLSEGWDSPESDFMVILRPTRSMVLAEQRMGRILRQRSGKVATVHEFVYDIIGDESPQVLHSDVLAQGERRYGVSIKPRQQPAQARSGHMYDFEDLEVDNTALSRVKKVRLEQLKTMQITSREDALPLDWITAEMACKKFGISPEEGLAVIVSLGAVGRYVTSGKRQAMYYPPTIQDALIEYTKIPRLSEHHITLQGIMRMQREKRGGGRPVSPTRMAKALSDNGYAAERVIDQNYTFVSAYNLNGRSVTSLLDLHGRQTGYARYERREVNNTIESVVAWLDRILIVPEDSQQGLSARDIGVAQSALMLAIKKLSDMPFADLDTLQKKLDEENFAPSIQMLNVMRARNLSLPKLLALAARARTDLHKKQLLATL